MGSSGPITAVTGLQKTSGTALSESGLLTPPSERWAS